MVQRSFIFFFLSTVFSSFAQQDTLQLKDFVYTGTLSELRKEDFSTPIEIYKKEYFLRNNVNNITEALSMISGIQANIDGAVDGAGDIEINGLEGIYTLIMIDGNPISGGNGGLYALSSIPFQIVERIEVIKGPSSTLYGTDAVAGVVNIITINPSNAKNGFSAKGTSYAENNFDVVFKLIQGKAAGILAASNYNQNVKWDFNKDNFTDIPIQNRLSIFNKWQFKNKYDKNSIVTGRYVFEKRWGGQMQFCNALAGNDSIYGESVKTNRLELFGNFQLPVAVVNLQLQTAYSFHQQNAFYGTKAFDNVEHNGRIQLVYNQKIAKKSDFYAGVQFRFTSYDDNLPTTEKTQNGKIITSPTNNFFPSFFIQDMVKINDQNEILAGLRYEYNTQYKGSTLSPRLDYKWNSKSKKSFVRLSIGSGFHTPSIFSDDRFAFANGLKIIIPNDVKTELGYGLSLAYEKIINPKNATIKLESRAFFNAIINKIEAIKDSIPGAVIYTNDGSHAILFGLNTTLDVKLKIPFQFTISSNIMKSYELLAEKEAIELEDDLINSPILNLDFNMQYEWQKPMLTFALTGMLNSPMYLNVLPDDYRPEKSPWYCLLNFQITKEFKKQIKLFAGVNNILNVKPKNIIMRPQDPFNKTVNDPIQNPYNYRFDTSYAYAPNQGAKAFLGISVNW